MPVQKPLPTIDEQATMLVRQANEAARRYLLSTPELLASTDQVREALTYGYLLGTLTGDGFWQKEIVAAAMKQRFGMTDEEFATDILGG